MWKNATGRGLRLTDAVMAALLGAAALIACEGPAGPAGVQGPAGDAGAPGAPGVQGATGGFDASTSRVHEVTGSGLKMTVTAAKLDASGTLVASVTVTDAAGAALDLSGKYTDGEVVAKLVVSALGASTAGLPGEYAPYTKQAHKSADGLKTADMADADTNGVWKEVGSGQGTYTYTFGTKLAGFDANKTHTIGVWAYRDMAGKRWVANTTYSFVPAGGTPAVRDIVTMQACNQCHNPIGQHEDGLVRRDPKLCILCHTTPMVDINNGNGLAMSTMVHKIHRGNALPSVIAGTPYELTASDGSMDDHSDTWFPVNNLQNCAKCHQGSQGDVWQKKQNRAVCTTCHDDIVFENPVPAQKKLHPGGVQVDDTKCATCHYQSGTPVDVVAAHATSFTVPNAPVIDLKIKSADSTGPGQTPVLHFTVTKSGAPLDILATKLNGLTVVLAGPTADYAGAQPTSYTVQGGAPVGTLVQDGAVGSYAYTFPASIPVTATGTYAIGMEGYINDQFVPTLRYASLNPVLYVPVTDAVAVPRRTVVDRAKCNSCHTDISEHGGQRKSVEYCVLCHTPNKVGDQRVARLEVPTTVAQSVSFDVLVHKIHRGQDLDQGYLIGEFPAPTVANPAGSPKDFGKVLFPGNQAACWTCHAGTSYTLPLAKGLLPVKTAQVLACNDVPLVPTQWCTNRTVQSEQFTPPISAACTACHDKAATVAHGQVMTTKDGVETCENCHGTGKQFDVQLVHQAKINP